MIQFLQKRYLFMIIFLVIFISFAYSLEKGIDMDTFTVHYYRFDGDYQDWTLWTWDNKTQQNSKEISLSTKDSNGIHFKVNRKDYGDGAQIGVLPKYRNWENKDAPDRIWTPSIGNEVWIIQGEPKLYTQKPDVHPSIQAAYLDSSTEITLAVTKSVSNQELDLQKFLVKDENNKPVPTNKIELIPSNSAKSRLLKLTLSKPLDIIHNHISQFRVAITGYQDKSLVLRKILDLPEFSSNERLGAIYSPEKTIFRVFAPIASSLTLVLYNEPVGSIGKEYPMKYGKNGVWEITVTGNLKNKYYTLKAAGSDKRFDSKRELIDPYSRSNTAHNGRGMIVDDKTSVTDRPNFDFSQAIIYEMHIRDISIDEKSGVSLKGKYLGLTESGTTIPGNTDTKTVLDHITELGVNVVQIMPFQDFENDESKTDYNWGYMPVHFDSPDGWYATERHNAKRVEEVKRMIDTFHKKGIKVIMDVVFNHTAENSDSKIFSFNGLVPGYYYRMKDDGSFWNGSGTGNEFRSESPMGRKFIIDSLKYWVSEYKVDGFRFDLMGLIDLKTVEQITKELHAIDPNIFIYGEPWAGGDTPIQITSKGSQKGKGFSVFNDNFRNAIKGSVFGNDNGYVQSGNYLSAIKKGIIGSITDFAQEPHESINYVECHDNRTFWDRLIYTTHNDKSITDADRIAMDKLGAALLFTSQGVPFIQTGQEFLRTKGGDENSYNKPDFVNAIQWQQKIEHQDVYQYYRGLIQLRKNHPMFRFKTKKEILDNVKFLDDDLKLQLPSNCLGYKITKGNINDSWNEVLVLANPNPTHSTIPIPGGNWTVVVNHKESGDKPVSSIPTTISGGKAELVPRSAMVLFR